MAVTTTWTNPSTVLGSGGLDVATDDELPETYFDDLASNLNRLGGTDGNTKTDPLGITGVTGASAASRYAGATASGAPASGTFAVGDFVIDQTGKVWVCTVAGTPGTWAQVGGALTTASANLAADVALTVANTFYDGPSVSLGPGTWFVFAQVSMDGGSTSSRTHKLWDGTTHFASSAGTSVGGRVSTSLAGFVTLAATTTIKVSVASPLTADKMLAASTANSPGNTATHIHAIRVG